MTGSGADGLDGRDATEETERAGDGGTVQCRDLVGLCRACVVQGVCGRSLRYVAHGTRAGRVVSVRVCVDGQAVEAMGAMEVTEVRCSAVLGV